VSQPDIRIVSKKSIEILKDYLLFFISGGSLFLFGKLVGHGYVLKNEMKIYYITVKRNALNFFGV